MTKSANRIREVRKARQITLERLAESVGLSPSYLSRLEKGTRQADVRHIINIAKALDCRPDELLPSYGSSELELIDTNAITIMVRGEVHAGHWTDALEWPQDDWQPITVPRPDGHPVYFGLKVKGPSMNREYPEGTILVCVSKWDYHHEIESGDHVIVHRHNGGGLSEATVKELVVDEDGRNWLWPRSTHPEHQTPIEIPITDPEEPDTAAAPDIEITAIVVADYRVRQRKKR